MGNYCLGTALFGTKIAEAEVNSMLKLFVESGNEYIDTALFYADWIDGKSECEKVIGKFLEANNCRKKVKIITKCCHPKIENLQAKRLNAKAINDDLQQSLENLKTNYIDILMLHKDDVNVGVEELIDELETLISQNIIKEYGFSNWSAKRINEVINYCQQKNYKGFTSLQLMWSLAKPNANYFDENEHVSYSEKFDAIFKKLSLKIFTYSSLGRGVFSKLKSKKTLVRRSVYNAYFNYNNLAIFHYLLRNGKSVLECEFGYLVSQPKATIIPIVGVSNLQQLREIVNSKPVEFAQTQIKKFSKFRNEEISVLKKIFLKWKYKTFFETKNLI